MQSTKSRAASAIETAASSLHAKAENMPGGERLARAARTTADLMEKAADYMRDRDLRGALSDLQQIAKRHPGATLLTAVAVGFLLARTFTRR